MFLLTEAALRRVSAISHTATHSRLTYGKKALPRAYFSTTLHLQKNPIDSAKEGLKKVDRAVSDTIVDGINKGAEVKDKLKEAAKDMTSGKTSDQAAELRGAAKGKAEELKGETKAAAAEIKGKAKETVEQL